MKKSLVVLLILALAATSVFAGISGYVDAKYQINFDNGDFGYTKPQDKLKASIKFDDHIGKKTGDGKVYIDAAASFTWNSKEKNEDEDGKRFAIDELGYFKLSLDKLMIVGQNWSLNLKQAEKLGGYAVSTLDSHTWFRSDHLKTKLIGFDVFEYDVNGKPVEKKLNRNDKDAVYFDRNALSEGIEYDHALSEDPEMVVAKARDDYKDYQKKIGYSILHPYAYYLDEDEDSGMNGVTFQYKGYKLALALNGHVGDKGNDQKAHNYYMAVETKKFNPTDGLTIQAAVGGSYRDNGWKKNYVDWDTANRINGGLHGLNKYNRDTSATNKWIIGGSLKGDYKTDKFIIDLATDHALETMGDHEDPKYYGATMLKAQLAPVNVQIFFSNRASSVAYDYKDYELHTNPGKDHDAIQESKKFYFSSQGLYKRNDIDNLLSAELGFDLQKLLEKVPVSVRVQGLNLISDYRILSAFVDVKLLEGNLKLQVYGKDLLASFKKVNGEMVNGAYVKGDYIDKFKNDDPGSYYYWDENSSKQKLGIDATYKMNDAITLKGGVFMTAGDTKIGGNVGVTYKADLFTADASVATELDYYNENNPLEYDKHRNQGKLQAKAGVTSDKIVDGAILSLVYESGNIINDKKDYDWFIGQQAGKLTAKCRVNF